MAEMSKDEKAAIRARCQRFLSFDKPRSAADWAAALVASPSLELDVYSEGPAITRLQDQIAARLGKEAALWFPKGIMAQQAALLVHAQVSGRRLVALHPKSHIALDEANALERLSGLAMVRVGKDHRHFTAEGLARVQEPLAAISLELPLRRAGFQAIPWADLAEVASWARAHGVMFHMDGARLWETQPWYGKPLAEIAALADSVYVSLYKGLGGLGGSVLAGSAAMVEAAKIWRVRFGGDLPCAFPMIATALDGLETTLPLMARRYRHACDIAAALQAVPGLTVFPQAPHCNSFQVHFQASADAMQSAALALAAETKTWLFGWFEQGLLPRSAFGEIVVGSATMEWTAIDAAAQLADLYERARAIDAA